MPRASLPRPVIVGLPGPELDASTEAALSALDPLGVILFARNVETPEQLVALTGAVRAALGRPDAPVLVDQEGGRVARLKGNRFRHPPAAAQFGRLWNHDPEAALRAAFLNARLIAEELSACGIDVDCAPVADVPARDAHDVIGDRAFHAAAAVVARLAAATARGLLAGGVQPVMKHLPGHGQARADSHLELPVVEADAATLAADMVPFRHLARLCPWAMTAHVLYPALDPDACASLSRRVIAGQVRGRIGFHGVLVSDDLGMQALQGSLEAKAAAVLAAGCDLALDCAPGPGHWPVLAQALPPMRPATARRLARARRMADRARRAPRGGFDAAAALAEVGALLARV